MDQKEHQMDPDRDDQKSGRPVQLDKDKQGQQHGGEPQPQEHPQHQQGGQPQPAGRPMPEEHKK